MNKIRRGLSFNSLQTGKRFQTYNLDMFPEFVTRFQFPSNGKAFPNELCVPIDALLIPKFQFPSNGKAFPNCVASRAVNRVGLCFNSLQTGKRFQTAPLANPVTERAKIAKTKRDRISEFFPTKILKNCQ